MKQFLAVFTGTPQAMERAGWHQLDSAERDRRTEQGIRAWQAWMQTHADHVVVAGGPLGKTLRVSSAGVQDTHNALCGYLVIRAVDHASAARLFEGHPHFTVFPGEAVEVLECLPTPGG